MNSKEIGRVSGDWIHLGYDTDQWWVVVNTVMNPCFYKMLLIC
jgi:hypothetical protein